MLKLYENIKNRRLQLGLTQAQLAEKLGYADKSMIAKIEKGQVDLSHSKIIAFANALNIDPGELMGEEDPQQQPYYLDPAVAQLAQELHDRPELQVMFDASRKLSAEDAEFVTSLIEKMSKNERN